MPTQTEAGDLPSTSNCGRWSIIDLRDHPSSPLLGQVYRELYAPSFTEPSEQETEQQYADRLWGSQQPPPQPVTHFLVAVSGSDGASGKGAGGSGNGASGDGASGYGHPPRSGELPNQPEIGGFLICEAYRGSGCGLLTFVVVNPACRGNGLGRRLIDRAREVLAVDLQREGSVEGFRGLFGEMHDPDRYTGQDVMDPRERIEFMRKVGARWIPIPYVQPELQPGSPRSRHLLLAAFPVAASTSANVEPRCVRDFLDEFYQALGVEDPQQDEDFRRLASVLEQIEDLEKPAGREARCGLPTALGTPREPILQFSNYAIAFHFVLEAEGQGTAWDPQLPPRSDIHFASFEHDLLAKTYRSAGLLRNMRIPLNADERPAFRREELKSGQSYQGLGVVVRFPPVVPYAAEGQANELPLESAFVDSPDSELQKWMRLRVSLTEFRTGIAVLNVVLTPDKAGPLGADGCTLTECQLVAFTKLWQGGEGVGPGDEADDLEGRILFQVEGASRAVRLSDVAQSLVKDINRRRERYLFQLQSSPAIDGPTDVTAMNRYALEPHQRPRGGTINLVTELPDDPPEEIEVKSEAASMESKRGSDQKIEPVMLALNKQLRKCVRPGPLPQPTDEELKVAIGGVLVGILDFQYVGDSEMDDTFANPVHGKKELDELAYLHKGTMFNLCRTGGDFDRIRETIGMSTYLLLPQTVLLHNEHWLQRGISRAYNVRETRNTKDLREAEIKIRQWLQQNLIPKIFHYDKEQKWQARGEESRGLVEMKTSLHEQLESISGRSRELISDAEGWDSLWLNVLLLFLAVMQVITGYDQLSRMLLDPGEFWFALAAMSVALILTVGLIFRRFLR